MPSVAGRLSDAIVFLTTPTFIKRIGNCPLGPIAQGRPATDWTEPGSPVMSRPTQGGLKRLSQTGRGFAELQHAPRLGPNSNSGQSSRFVPLAATHSTALIHQLATGNGSMSPTHK